MPAILFSVLRKFAPTIIFASLLFFSGGYAGYRFEYGAVEAAKLTLATQQKNDAIADATANALAATHLVEVESRNNTVEASLALAETKNGDDADALSAQIEKQADEAGQDASDAPVLASVLDHLAREHP